MRNSVSKKTLEYLSLLEQMDKDKPDYYINDMDAIDKVIYESGLRIKQLYFDEDLDLMMILLTNRKIITLPISISKRLADARPDQMTNYENDGFGVRWPELDEDLSLRGFLEYEIKGIAAIR